VVAWKNVINSEYEPPLAAIVSERDIIGIPLPVRQTADTCILSVVSYVILTFP